MDPNNNNFSQNFNSQNTNDIKPTQPVKNKFFNFDFDSSENDVGGAVSDTSHNVISWGVGKKEAPSTNFFDNNSTSYNNETLDDYLITQVNSDFYNGNNIETLEEFTPDIPNKEEPSFNNNNSANEPMHQNFFNSSFANEANNQMINYGNQSTNYESQNYSNNNYNEILEAEMPKLNEDYLNSIVNSQENLNNPNNTINTQDFFTQTNMNNNQNNNDLANNQFNNMVQDTSMTQQFISPIFAEAEAQSQNNNQAPVNSSTMFQNNQQPNYNRAPEGNNSSWQDGLGTVNPQGDSWMNYQPLSAASLGGVSLAQEDAPKDVIQESRFFNANMNNEKASKPETQPQNNIDYGNRVGIVLDDPPPVYNEIDFLKQYIGQDFTSLNLQIFSFSTLIFGSLPFLNRKMYIVGIISALIEASIVTFLPIQIAIVGILIFHIFLAFMLAPLYKKQAKKEVQKIINNKANQKKNIVELNEICRKKGQKNLIKAIIIYILCCGSIYALSFMTDFSGYFKKGINFVSNKINNVISSDNENKEENPAASDKKTFNIEDYLNITIPSTFIREESETYSYVYITVPDNSNSSCRLSIKELDEKTNIEEYLEEIKSKNNIAESIGKTSTNNITWYTISNIKETSKEYYRTTEIDKTPIILEYTIGPETKENICESNYAQIISSITLK